MTKTRFLALLSVLALLASLPLTVALAQGAPFLVVGEAEVDGEAAMMGTTVVAMSGEGEDAMMWEGMVVDDQGNFSILVDDGEADAMLSFSIKMGEGDEAMEYMAESAMDVMIGGSGEASDMVMLAAYSDPDNRPAPAAPTKTAQQEMEAMRGPQGRPGSTAAPGEMGPQGETGAKGNTGARGPAGPDGAKGDTGDAGPSRRHRLRRQRRRSRIRRFRRRQGRHRRCRSRRTSRLRWSRWRTGCLRRRSPRHSGPHRSYRRHSSRRRRLHSRPQQRLTPPPQKRAQATNGNPRGAPATGAPLRLPYIEEPLLPVLVT